MPKRISPKLISISFGVLILTVFLGFYIFAWTEPSQAPPGNNILAPLNVGPEGQAKEGGLILNTGGAATGLIIDQGNVGIGIMNPTAKLHIASSDSMISPFQITSSGSIFLSGWNYRREITISNAGSEITENHQVLVILNDTPALITSGKMKSNCEDIRFTNFNRTLLDYWIESGCNTPVTKIWVKIPSIPSGSSIFYIYYNNPSALSESDGDSTFEFFDDFTGTVIDTNKWIEIDPDNSISQNNNLILNDVSNSWTKVLISQQTFDRSNDKKIYVNLTIPTDTSGNNHFMVGWELDQISNPSYDQMVHGFYWDNYLLSTYEKGSHTGPNTQSYSANTDYEMKIELKSTGAKYYIKGGIYNSWTLVKETSTYSDSLMRIAFTQYSHQANIHHIFIQKYSSLELTTSVGEEEINTEGITITRLYIQPETGNIGIGTESPAQKLDVIGSINATQLCIDGDCKNTWSSVQDENYFGDGSDGDITVSGTLTLTRDMYYNNLTVPAGRVIKTNGFQIFVKGTLQNSGRIENVGNPGSGRTGGSGAKGVTVGIGSVGGTGANIGPTCFGGSGSNHSASGGEKGGIGGPGNGGSSISQIKSFTALHLTRLNSGGGGRGGNAGYTGNCLAPAGKGGGGGGGGGTIVIFTNTFINPGTIIVQGGNGGNASCHSNSYGSTWGNGGGGGGGGFIAIGTTGTPTIGTINVSGGTGGNACGSGSGGSTYEGGNGNYVIFYF
ncbi:MAG: hypothetical protein CMI54_06955 [Parcubacteria group bacterium]|nr:hypothetical protein [Parcubacteria group bacterium]|tara:strand:- start:3990 stop:6173 length:2184 start_codon:yes stop_codon:yes gene_type:complete